MKAGQDDLDGGARYAYRTLQLSAAIFLALNATLLFSKYSVDLSRRLCKPKFEAAPEEPPKAWYQSIDQDLASWNSTGITFSHVCFIFI